MKRIVAFIIMICHLGLICIVCLVTVHHGENRTCGVVTSSAKDMEDMFSGCKLLEELDSSFFDTGNVIDMSSMFSGSNNLKELNLSGFRTESVTDMRYFVASCLSLEELDMSLFNIESVNSKILSMHNK